MAVYLGNQRVGVNTVAPLKEVLLRPDAELVQTYTCDRLLAEDDEVTIPTYSTSSATLLASTALSPTITLDTNYNYFIQGKLLTIPIYSVTTKAKGRAEYSLSTTCYEVLEVPGNTFQSLLDGTNYASTIYHLSAQTATRLVYYSSGTAVTIYNPTTAYGLYQTVTAPTISSGVLTINAPPVTIRGHTTYLTQTYYNAITDIRRQYIYRVYRVPKDSLNVDGWSARQNFLSIINDANSTTHTLT